MERVYDLLLAIRNNLTFLLSMPIIDRILRDKTKEGLTKRHDKGVLEGALKHSLLNAASATIFVQKSLHF